MRTIGSSAGREQMAAAFALLIGAPLTLVGCAMMQTTFRYRLTVVVDTPKGIRTGSSVVEMRGNYYPVRVTDAPQTTINIRDGEATPVELADGKYLFVVFAWSNYPSTPVPMLFDSFADQLPPVSKDPDQGSESDAERFATLAKARGVREVRPEHYPVIATFTNRLDPDTIKITPTAELSRILPGYRVSRMSLEITDAPASRRILSIIPWLVRNDLGFIDPAVKANPNDSFPEYRKIEDYAFVRGKLFRKKN